MSGITRVYRTYEASTPGQLTTMRMKGSSVIPIPHAALCLRSGRPGDPYQPDGRATALQFEWDRAGRPCAAPPPARRPCPAVTDYSYDAAGQLTGLDYRSAGGKLGEIRYSYDAAGRRTGIGGSLNPIELPGASVTDAQYDARNRLTRWAGRTLRYDANGNLIDDGVRTYTGTSATNCAGSPLPPRDWCNSATTLRAGERSATGRRVARLHPRRREPAQEFDRHSKITTLHGPAVDMPQIRQDSDGTERFLLQDGNGNVIGLSDGLGTTLETQYRYEPYGKSRVLDRPAAIPSNTRGGRTMPPGCTTTGRATTIRRRARFVSPDPIGWAAGQTNGYAYVGGDPLNLVDPDGEVSIYQGPTSQCMPTLDRQQGN